MEAFKNLAENLTGRNATNGQSMITRSSNKLVPLPSDEDRRNYREAMLPVVSDSFEFSSQTPTTAEKLRRADAWAKILFNIVPEERLPDAFVRAVELHATVFPVNGYEIKLAWEQIEAEERCAAASLRAEVEASKNPVDACPNRAAHINRDGEVEVCSPLNFAIVIVLPCPMCRPKAYETARTAYIVKNRMPEEVEPLRILEKIVAAKKPAIVEVQLSAEEIGRIRDEHNRLVREIVAEPEARRNLELIWDEGGQVFKLPHRADITHSPEVVKKKIESYLKILEDK